MKKHIGSTIALYACSIVLLFFPVLSFADRFHNIFEDEHWHSNPIDKYQYKECLRDLVQKNQNLSADDIRSLCKEITAKPDPVYEYKNGEIVPSNEFTRCFVERLKASSEEPEVDFLELAKLLCFYTVAKDSI
jgi:hypothetical protein